MPSSTISQGRVSLPPLRFFPGWCKHLSLILSALSAPILSDFWHAIDISLARMGHS